MRGPPATVAGQLTFDQLVTIDRAVAELRTACEAARAAHRLRYAGELETLADHLATVMLEHAPPDHPRITRARPRF